MGRQMMIEINGEPICGIPERPKETEIITAIGMGKLAIEVHKWLSQDSEPNETVEEIQEDLMEIYDSFSDGFALAKKLDDKGWEVNTDLVNILDNAQSYIYTALNNAVQAWVEQYDIKPPFPIGHKVKITNNRKRITNKAEFIAQEVSGEITKIWEKEAKYTIYCESLGHVRVGEGTHGIVKNYEEVREFNEGISK